MVIGPSGVWVVDSKAYRTRLRVRRGRVWAGRHPVPTDPVAWEANRVGELLAVDVTPLVVVHGEGLRRRGARSGGIRVVPASGLLRRVRGGPMRRLGGPVLGAADRPALARRAQAALTPYGEVRAGSP